MAKVHGDEEGLFWSTPVKVGRSASGKTLNENGGTTVPKQTVQVLRELPSPPKDYKLPTEFPRFSEGKVISFDLETYDPDLKTRGPGSKRDGYIVGFAIRTGDWRGDYYPIRHSNGPNLEQGPVIRWLQDEFKKIRPGTVLTGTNLLYEGEYAQSYGINVDNVTWRPIDFAEPLLDENQHSYSLESIATRWLQKGKVTDELKQLYGDNFKNNFDRVHPGHARAYGLGDVDLPLEVLPLQQRELESQGLSSLFDLECRLIPMLLYMRDIGVRVDLDAANNFNDRLDVQVSEEQTKIRDMIGFDVNVNSGDSLAKAFDSLGLDYPKTTQGNPSFVAPWLANHPHPLAECIVNARKYSKFKGTFVESYILDSHVDGRIYGQFHPLRGMEGGTVTGRFSSSKPDLQNIPTRDDVLGPMCRSMFLPDEGMDWWSLDWSQIEFRLLVHYAYLAKCIGAIEAATMYRENPDTDFHIMVAELTGLPRKSAKNTNFGFVYGMGVFLLALGLGLIGDDGQPLPEAHEMFETYHRRAPFIKAIYNLASSRASSQGYIRTILNRKRRFDRFEPWGNWKKVDGVWVKTQQRQPKNSERPPALLYDDAILQYGKNIKRAFVHKALNAVLQGSAADMMKMAMVMCWEAGLFGKGKPLQCHLTVHDELDGSKERSNAGDEALREVRHIMETCIPLQVPVLVSQGIGANWAEAK